MRMEELSESRYIKSTDTVERYLLNLVEQYFSTHNVASTTSREYIIKKAIERMKEELSYDDIGVLSITLPSGEKRTGAISISLADLHGEPLITPKLSAFNVPFGAEQNTACEGNDPRLSDAREPLAHNHQIEDIIGLEGKLSTILGKLERVNNLSHSHANKSVLDMLIYTGNRTSIDLGIIETLESKVNKIVQDIRDEIAASQAIITTKASAVNFEILTIKNQIDDLKTFVLQKNTEYLTQAKAYTDSEIALLEDFVQNSVNGIMTKEKILNLISIAKSVYIPIGSMSFTVASSTDVEAVIKQRTKTININPSLVSELTTRNITLDDCQIEAFIEYTKDGATVSGALPFVLFKDDKIDGAVQISTISINNQITITINTASGIIPTEIKTASIVYNVYAKEQVII